MLVWSENVASESFFSVEWRNVRHPAAVFSSSSGVPTQFAIVLTPFRVTLFFIISTVDGLMVLLGREKQGEMGLWHLLWTQSLGKLPIQISYMVELYPPKRYVKP